MKLDNRGFTLIELIATVIVLALVTSIAAYSITGIMKRSKEELYNRLVSDIKDAAELYYQECKYAKNDTITCNGSNNTYMTSLSALVSYGYLSGNSSDSSDNYTIVNPKDDTSIGNCEIKIEYVLGKIIVTSMSSDTNCPTY